MTPRIFLWIILSSAVAQDMEEGKGETNQTDVRGERLVLKFYQSVVTQFIIPDMADISTCCSKSPTTSPTTLSPMVEVEDCSICSSRQSDLSMVTTPPPVVVLCARDLSLPQPPRHLHHPAPRPPRPPP